MYKYMALTAWPTASVCSLTGLLFFKMLQGSVRFIAAQLPEAIQEAFGLISSLLEFPSAN